MSLPWQRGRNKMLLKINSYTSHSVILLQDSRAHPWLLPCSHHKHWQGSSQHPAPWEPSPCWDTAVSFWPAPTYSSSHISNRHAFINCCPSSHQSPVWSKAPKSTEVSPCQNLFWFPSAAYKVFFLSKKKFLKFIILISCLIKMNYDLQYVLEKLCKTYDVTDRDINYVSFVAAFKVRFYLCTF